MVQAGRYLLYHIAPYATWYCIFQCILCTSCSYFYVLIYISFWFCFVTIHQRSGVCSTEHSEEQIHRKLILREGYLIGAKLLFRRWRIGSLLLGWVLARSPLPLSQRSHLFHLRLQKLPSSVMFNTISLLLQLAVMSAFLGPDQAATEERLIADPDCRPWVDKYQRSRETVSRTDYEVRKWFDFVRKLPVYRGLSHSWLMAWCQLMRRVLYDRLTW